MHVKMKLYCKTNLRLYTNFGATTKKQKNSINNMSLDMFLNEELLFFGKEQSFFLEGVYLNIND